MTFSFAEHIDLDYWVKTLGYLGLCATVFAETGLFFCFFLPGDSLLFTAGLLASRGVFHIGILIPLLIITAFLGYMLGYWFGARLGGWLIKRPDRWWYKKIYVERAHTFYEKHGKGALLLGRLVPVIRTFIPVVAGMAKMERRPYLIYNLFGAILWGGFITLGGYFLGGILPDANQYLLLAIACIIVLSIAPVIIHWLKKHFTK